VGTERFQPDTDDAVLPSLSVGFSKLGLVMLTEVRSWRDSSVSITALARRLWGNLETDCGREREVNGIQFPDPEVNVERNNGKERPAPMHPPSALQPGGGGQDNNGILQVKQMIERDSRVTS
jgi:hypothetical protein